MATIRTPYTDTTIQKRVISAMIGLIDWTEVPTLKRLGINKDDSFNMQNWPPGNSKKVEWLEDTLPPTTDTLNGAIDASQTNIVATNGSYFHQGHVIQIDSEYMIVDSVSNNTLTVLRAQGGTSGATHSNAATITLITIAQKTGANYSIGYTTTMTAPYNYCQILEESVRVNKDQQLAHDYGVEDTKAYHLSKLIGGRTEIGAKGKAGILPLRLQNTFWYGKRQQPSDTSPGMMGGIATYVSTNNAGDTSTALTRPTIETAFRNIWGYGGKPDLIICSAWAMTKINSFYEGFVETERSEARGGSVIRYLNSPVVTDVEIMIDQQCPNTKLYILESDKVGWCTVRPWDVYDMPSLGDYTVNSVLGEYSLVLQNEKAHAIITHSSSL
jgi:hypothetical protein